MKRKRKLKTSTIILIVVCFIGLSLLLYPTVADFYNTHFAIKSVTEYTTSIEEIEEDEFQDLWTAAVEYNQRRSEQGTFTLPENMQLEYYSLLNVSGNGMMGFVEIPKLNLQLPIYHGTSDSVLESAIGHLEWSSLPVGGPGTHCCISGHRGLATAKLFTNLDQLREGDQFMLNIFDEMLTYEVDQIRTVLPTEMSDLAIVPEQDYCTMITCTPYGINTHRLLVRGHRIETAEAEIRVVSEAVLIDNLMVAMFLAIPILFLLVMAVMLKKPEQKPDPDRTASKPREVKPDEKN